MAAVCLSQFDSTDTATDARPRPTSIIIGILVIVILGSVVLIVVGVAVERRSQADGDRRERKDTFTKAATETTTTRSDKMTVLHQIGGPHEHRTSSIEHRTIEH